MIVAYNILLMLLSSVGLYIYYQGAWYDPIKWIEITEVVLLYVIDIVSFCMVGIYVRALFKIKR